MNSPSNFGFAFFSMLTRPIVCHVICNYVLMNFWLLNGRVKCQNHDCDVNYNLEMFMNLIKSCAYVSF
jgi:hypothetical protein